MSGPYYNSGAAAANSLQDILSRRKDEARQAMLDELTRQKQALNEKEVDASIAAQKDQMETNRMWRQAQADELSAHAGERFLGQFHKGQQVGPETLAKAKGYGVADAFDSGVNPESGSLTGPAGFDIASMDVGQAQLADPSVPNSSPNNWMEASATGPEAIVSHAPSTRGASYLGSPKEVAEEDKRNRYFSFMSDPTVGDMEPMQKALLYNLLTGDNPSADILGINHDVPLQVFDQATGELTIKNGPDGKPMMVPKGAGSIINRTRPPRPLAVRPISPKPSKTPAALPAALIQNYSKSVKDLEGTKHWWAKEGSPAGQTAVGVATQAIINRGSNPNAKNFVRSVLADKGAMTSPETTTGVVDSMMEEGELTPAERAEVIDILSQVRGK